MDNRIDSALIALRQILRATEMNSRALAKKSGLSTSQHIVLQLLSDKSGLTQGAVAAEVCLSQATVTTLIDRLEERKLVVRQRSSQDKRRILLEITDLGRQTLTLAPSLLQGRFQSQFTALDPWEQALLVASLERTAKMMGAEGLDVAPVLQAGDIVQQSE